MEQLFLGCGAFFSFLLGAVLAAVVLRKRSKPMAIKKQMDKTSYANVPSGWDRDSVKSSECDRDWTDDPYEKFGL